MPHPTNIIAVERPTVPPAQASPAVRTLSRRGLLFRFVQITEESSVPANGRTVDLRLAVDGVPHRLGQ